jgi:hypothetical protein
LPHYIPRFTCFNVGRQGWFVTADVKDTDVAKYFLVKANSNVDVIDPETWLEPIKLGYQVPWIAVPPVARAKIRAVFGMHWQDITNKSPDEEIQLQLVIR